MPQDQPLTHIIGNVGKDPARKTIPPTSRGTTELVEFTLAVPVHYGFGQESKWYTVSVWDDELKEEVLNNVHKGTPLAITGHGFVKEWEGKKQYSIMAGRIYRLTRLGKGPAVPLTQTPKGKKGEEPDDF